VGFEELAGPIVHRIFVFFNKTAPASLTYVGAQIIIPLWHILALSIKKFNINYSFF
jgi:hypothetical protein